MISFFSPCHERIAPALRAQVAPPAGFKAFTVAVPLLVFTVRDESLHMFLRRLLCNHHQTIRSNTLLCIIYSFICRSCSLALHLMLLPWHQKQDGSRRQLSNALLLCIPMFDEPDDPGCRHQSQRSADLLERKISPSLIFTVIDFYKSARPESIFKGFLKQVLDSVGDAWIQRYCKNVEFLPHACLRYCIIFLRTRPYRKRTCSPTIIQAFRALCR